MDVMKKTYNHYDRLMQLVGDVLPELENINACVSAVVRGHELTKDQHKRLDMAFERADDAKKSWNAMLSDVGGVDSPEALFVRSAVAGGLNNSLARFVFFNSFRNDIEYAKLVERRALHPYFRLSHDTGLLIAATLDFTAGADGENGFMQVENPDGRLADRLRRMIVRRETRPHFLKPVFVSGMNVQGTSIVVPF